jgi:hypothetical protein
MDASRKKLFVPLALVLLAGLAWSLPAVVASYLPEILKSQGFQSVALTVKSAGWTHLTLENVALDKVLLAKKLKVGFSPFGLASLEARDLTLTATTDGKKLKIGPISLPLAGHGGGSGIDLPLLRLDQARFDLDTQWGNLQGVLSSEPEGAATRLRLDLTSTSKPALVSPLILTGIVSEEGNELRFAGRLNDPGHRFQIKIEGLQDNRSASGSAKIALERTQFAPDGLQPQVLFPLLEPYLKDVNGPLEGAVNVSWQNGKLSSDAKLSTPGLSFEARGAQVRNLMGSLALDRAWPPRTATPQNFSLGMLTAGIPLGSGSFAFSLDEDGSLDVKRAVLNLADGKLRLTPTKIAPDMTGRLDFQASNLDLGKLAPLFQIQGITLGGAIEGTIPVLLGKDSIRVAEAKLSAQQKGYVRYRPLSVPPALQAGGEGVSLLMAALKDFHYESLAMALDGQAGGETTVEFHITGRNPGLHDGKPFEFNFRLTGPLDKLAQQAYGIVALPEDIEAAYAR